MKSYNTNTFEDENVELESIFLKMKYSASKTLLWWQHWLSGHPFVGRGTELVVESSGL